MLKRRNMLLLINLLILNSCSLFITTLKIEVPSDFVGWCHVIPNNDSLIQSSPIVDGKYQVDTNGVVLIPKSVFDIKKDHIIKVYDSGSDISNDMRYASTIHRVSPADSLRVDYIHFYLPSKAERKIPNSSDYWREKMDEYLTIRDKLFDSLLKGKKLGF
jgi:hypothetical protein